MKLSTALKRLGLRQNAFGEWSYLGETLSEDELFSWISEARKVYGAR